MLIRSNAVIEVSQPEVRPDLTIHKRLVKILDRAEEVLRHKMILVVKVLWSSQAGREAIWETEDSMGQHYLELSN